MKQSMLVLFCILTPVLSAFAQNKAEGKRNTISLNGKWQIAEGTKEVIPKTFDHTVQVPGLVSLAVPSFNNVGPKVEDRRNISQSDPLREAFWYRRTFTVKGSIPARATLKVSKAM
ncbi:MAG: hypothetical protein ABI288_10015, partial [Ginsengibacter sp.]